MYYTVFFVICSILWVFIVWYKIKDYLHILQLESYRTDKFKKWINENSKKIYKYYDVLFVFLSVILTNLYYGFPDFDIVIIVLYTVLYIVYLWKLINNKITVKKPFVYTKRAKRLIIITALVVITYYALVISATAIISDNIYNYYSICLCIMSLIALLSVYYVLLADIFSNPIENRINNKFYIMASKKIRTLDNLTTVAITGSYGKTSTKFITASILSEKYNVLKTPSSYNTPMGISKIINNELSRDTQIFIAELGATRAGDIKEVAYLTHPKIGVITSIGPCHLKSFGSMKCIMDTKYELIDYLGNDGLAIFNYDNERVRELADKTAKRKLLYAIEHIEEADVYAQDIEVNDMGSSFSLIVKNIGRIKCHTALLGKHNILNILAGVSVAIAFDLSLEDIKNGISEIKPVEHRLNLINPKTGVLVIDDAFNSNPDGADAALDVLGEFVDRRKIIVTPGMIELGEIEKRENEKFGEKISKICDIVILIGKKRTEPIYNGLVKSSYNPDNIYIVDSIGDSTTLIKDIARQGDIILYENDLPDTYDEI